MNIQTPELTYGYTEVQKLLGSLSDADNTRLLQIYRTSGCEQRAGLTAHDVLSEVVCKLLAMERTWPREVETMPYLVETGRSVISNEEKKRTREIATDPELLDRDEVNPHTSVTWVEATHPSPATQATQCQADLNIEEWVCMMKELFYGDDDATCFIKKRLSDFKKAAIIVACNFTDQTYRNVEKRIKDKVRKRFPQGFPWWEIM
jgi:hypothetical protein